MSTSAASLGFEACAAYLVHDARGGRVDLARERPEAVDDGLLVLVPARQLAWPHGGFVRQLEPLERLHHTPTLCSLTGAQRRLEDRQVRHQARRRRRRGRRRGRLRRSCRRRAVATAAAAATTIGADL